MLQSTSETLTSLCLDWVFTAPNVLGSSREPGAPREWFRAFARLFSLRFPQLKAFQLRNATVPETMIPPGLLLLDRSRVTVHNKLPDIPVADYALNLEEKERLDLACLEFMEAHCNLQCLAWPIHAFFTEHGPAADISSRVENVIEALGRSLVDLRVDAHFSGYGESLTEEVESRDFGRSLHNCVLGAAADQYKLLVIVDESSSSCLPPR
nr:hypothetical protein CFP56_20626 [Quercus suber]